MWFKVKKHIFFHIHYCCSPLLRLSETRFLQSSSFWKARCALIGQLSSVLWLAKYLKLETETLCPNHIWKRMATTWWQWRQQYCSENKMYAFFLCINIWTVFCKSSNTVLYICGGVFKWGVLGIHGRVSTFKEYLFGLETFQLYGAYTCMNSF